MGLFEQRLIVRCVGSGEWGSACIGAFFTEKSVDLRVLYEDALGEGILLQGRFTVMSIHLKKLGLLTF